MKKRKKILIFGAKGMIGQEFVNYLKRDKLYEVVTPGRATVDIAKFEQVLKIIKKIKPDVIINCAAIINVDYCEKNPVTAFKVNAIGAGNLLSALEKLNFLKTVVLHISTSDVFGNNNKKVRAEDDIPVPVNIYGWSKLGGEKILAATAKNKKIKYFIIRTSWIYSEHKDTFVDFVVNSLKDKKFVSIISDQYNTITWARDLVEASGKLIRTSHKYKSGIYHITNRSKTKLSKYNIALEIAKQLKFNKKYLKKGFKDDIFDTARPDCAILAKNKFINMPIWNNSLIKYLNLKYGKK